MPTTPTSPSTPNTPDSTFEVGPYYCTLRISDYVRPTPFGDIKRENTWSLVLPIPTELREESPTDWSTPSMMSVGDLQNLDIAGGMQAAVLRNAGQLVQAAGSMLGAKLLPDSFQKTGKFEALGLGLKELFPADDVSTAVQQYFGVAPNPNQTVAFQGPQLRTFNFSWTFNPRTKEESQRYQVILKKLRSRSLPTLTSGKSSAVLRYPSIVQMNFYPWDSMGTALPGSSPKYGWRSESIIKMKTCIISNVVVNYAPGNVPAFFEGTRLPTVIQLSISLREIEYMLGHDYDEREIKSTIGDFLTKAIEAVAGTTPTPETPAPPPATQAQIDKYGADFGKQPPSLLLNQGANNAASNNVIANGARQ